MSAVGTVSIGLPTCSEWATPRLARHRGLEQSSDSRADVVLAATAEPQRVHGQRPWFQTLMTNAYSLFGPYYLIRTIAEMGMSLSRPRRELNRRRTANLLTL